MNLSNNLTLILQNHTSTSNAINFKQVRSWFNTLGNIQIPSLNDIDEERYPYISRTSCTLWCIQTELIHLAHHLLKLSMHCTELAHRLAPSTCNPNITHNQHYYNIDNILTLFIQGGGRLDTFRSH